METPIEKWNREGRTNFWKDIISGLRGTLDICFELPCDFEVHSFNNLCSLISLAESYCKIVKLERFKSYCALFEDFGPPYNEFVKILKNFTRKALSLQVITRTYTVIAVENCSPRCHLFRQNSTKLLIKLPATPMSASRLDCRFLPEHLITNWFEYSFFMNFM